VKTYLDCIPCFFRQALEAARISGAGPEIQKAVLDDVARKIQDFSLNSSPPEMARTIHHSVKKHTGITDPYLKVKDKSNQMALSIYPQIKKKVHQSRDPFATAVQMAIAGNIIDYGAKNKLDVDKELGKILEVDQTTLSNQNGKYFQIKQLKNALKESETILYLADNAGEAVFDRVLIEEIRRVYTNKTILYAVKERPIINDALKKDAMDCGVEQTATVFSSGSDAPGTVLHYCSNQFLKVFEKANVVISKGQGNFEGLSHTSQSVFFLLVAKCSVIAQDIGCRVGQAILLNLSESVFP